MGFKLRRVHSERCSKLRQLAHGPLLAQQAYMLNVDDIIESYSRADEGGRMTLFLEFRDLRAIFSAIDDAQAAADGEASAD